MKLLKYQKLKLNEYKIITDKDEYKLYDDIIIKYELLLKKEIGEEEIKKIVEENNSLKAYYTALRLISVRLRTDRELNVLLNKKGYSNYEIDYAIKRLNKEDYLNHNTYIEAYIHDRLNLYVEGENKIATDLIKLGFKIEEVLPFLDKIDKQIFREKIEKYITKKVKSNRKSALEFKRKTLNELINKGFSKLDINEILDTFMISDDDLELEHLINKLYKKYSLKYDNKTTILKIKNYLYQKGYQSFLVEEHLKKLPS